MRAAKRATCSGCYAAVLIGLDDDKCAVMAKVDAAPLPEPVALHEIAARLAGRMTYSLHPGGGNKPRWELHARVYLPITRPAGRDP